MAERENIKILLVDDQVAKLLSYEVVLKPLDVSIIKANSAQEALDLLLRHEVAVILIDVFMPELDGFELASMIRAHPRFQQTAIIFVSAVLLDDVDRMRGYEMGAVDYVPVPVVPEVLRAKVRVFIDLYRKTKALEILNEKLERRVEERTAELKAALEHQTLLSREVDHRARNAMAVVQSIVRLTKGSTISDYVSSLEGRLKALSVAHELLSQSRWEGADLRGLVGEELAPYGERGFKVSSDGPKVLLNAAIAQTMALALHELATNAAKYGALSTPEGVLRVHWHLTADRLMLEWLEGGGPAVNVPQRKGIGSRIINASIGGQLGGDVSFDWRPEGLKCLISVPLVGVAQAVTEKPDVRAGSSTTAHGVVSERILLVEDEPLVALMMLDMLQELGFAVAGPYSRTADAADALRSGAVRSAVLDVNLGQEFVYPVADLLMARDIPFVFVTGYDSGGIDERFSHVPVLSKPVDRAELKALLLQDEGGLRKVI